MGSVEAARQRAQTSRYVSHIEVYDCYKSGSREVNEGSETAAK